MPTVVLHFDFHLPPRLRNYGYFDIGQSRDYFDGEESREALERFAEGFALPAASLLLRLIRRHRGRFRVSLSVSGMLLEQMEKGQKPLLESFRRLADTGCAEMVCGVSHHSLASLFSETEFRRQAALHRRMIRARFGQTPRVFRNTAGLCDDRVSRVARSMGFRVILTEDAGGTPGRNAETLCRPLGSGGLTAITRNGPLSDGMAVEDAEAFAKRLAGGYDGDETIGLMTDCVGFTGSEPGGAAVLRFLETVPALLLERRHWRFLTPTEAAAHCRPGPAIHPFPPGRGGEALLGNSLQRDAANTLYALEERVRRTNSRRLLDIWRKLQASDYMGYLSTKGLSEGVQDRTPNPFASPYDAYIHIMNILKDFSGRIDGKSEVRP